MDVLLTVCGGVCVCSLSLPDFVCHSKCLPITVGRFPVWDQSPDPGGEEATKLHFQFVLSCASGAWHRAFPLNLQKSLTSDAKHPLYPLASKIHIS